MSSLQERINGLLGEHKVRQAHLAKVTGVSRNTVSGWVNGDIRTIKHDNALKIAKYFDISSEWIETGKNPKYPVKLASAVNITEPLVRQAIAIISTLPESEIRNILPLLKSLKEKYQ